MELAHEKSHDLLSASWRIRKASDIIWSQFEGLPPTESDGISLSPET